MSWKNYLLNVLQYEAVSLRINVPYKYEMH